MERRSAPALSKIEDLNTFILFDKNQSEFEAITEYVDLDVPLQVGLLAWRPLKQRLPAAPRRSEHSPNATTHPQRKRPNWVGPNGEQIEIVENLMQRWVAVTHAVLHVCLPWA